MDFVFSDTSLPFHLSLAESKAVIPPPPPHLALGRVHTTIHPTHVSMNDV